MAEHTLSYDLSTVTAAQMDTFFRAVETNDIKVLADVFAVVVVTCPFGDPRNPDTYLNLPFYGAFKDVLKGMIDAAKKAASR